MAQTIAVRQLPLWSSIKTGTISLVSDMLTIRGYIGDWCYIESPQGVKGFIRKEVLPPREFAW